MAQNLSLVTIFLVLLLFTSVCFTTEARPLNDHVKPDESYMMSEVIENMYNEYYIDAIKSAAGGGPLSHGGKGHDDIPNFKTLGEIKDSGPAPGGKGHEFVNAATLGERKDSGPAPGGKGH